MGRRQGGMAAAVAGRRREGEGARATLTTTRYALQEDRVQRPSARDGAEG